ncbi:MAG: hypothetical protein IRY87_35065 [Acetobacteraceae bacterium]|mgnify:CR=1 FL=1|nr:hypothetical protein [Acetobacteraceae bacterium]
MPTVTLVMAAGPGFPGGSPAHRYELDVALDAAGHLDARAWQTDPRPWVARRYWPGEPMLSGEVLYDPDTGWSMRFSPRADDAGDAPLHEVIRGPALMRPGDYLTIREPDGAEYSYRIVSTG